jgi:hypothetical protein
MGTCKSPAAPAERSASDRLRGSCRQPCGVGLRISAVSCSRCTRLYAARCCVPHFRSSRASRHGDRRVAAIRLNDRLSREGFQDHRRYRRRSVGDDIRGPYPMTASKRTKRTTTWAMARKPAIDFECYFIMFRRVDRDDQRRSVRSDFAAASRTLPTTARFRWL